MVKKFLMTSYTAIALLLLTGGNAVRGGSIDKLRPVYERIVASPIMSPEMTAYQRSMLAFMLASGQTGVHSGAAVDGLFGESSARAASLLKSDTAFTWDTDHWVKTDRTTYTYNANDLLATEVAETLSVTTWYNESKSLYTYNGNGKMVTATFQTWESSAWTNEFLQTISYDGSGNPTSMVMQTWNGSAWVNYNQMIGTYSSGRLTSMQSNNWSGSAWVNDQLDSYTYNGSGKMIEELSQSWSGSAWTNFSRTTSTYTGGGDLATTVDQTWQGGAWVNTVRHAFVYNGSHQETVDTTSTWFSSFWYDYYVDSTKYNGSLVTETVYASLLFPGGNRHQFTYNGQNNLILELVQYYDMGTSQYVNASKTVSVYDSGGSCCVGMRGNVNNSGGIELADLSALVSYLTGGGYVPPCLEAANVNGTGAVELADLSALVSYLTGGGYTPPSCP
ncbi:MAG: hypothetical protein WAU88_00845 [Candidatus Zixiibacteriota bacterium]